MSLERARKHLEKYGLAERIHLTEESSATVELAALAVGVEPGRIAKTLSFMIDGRPALILAEGTARIDNRKFKDTFHTKAKMIPSDQVEELVGHAPGGVCPFGINDGIPVFPAAGTGNSDIELTIPELEECSEMTGWVDVCRA